MAADSCYALSFQHCYSLMTTVQVIESNEHVKQICHTTTAVQADAVVHMRCAWSNQSTIYTARFTSERDMIGT